MNCHRGKILWRIMENELDINACISPFAVSFIFGMFHFIAERVSEWSNVQLGSPYHFTFRFSTAIFFQMYAIPLQWCRTSVTGSQITTTGLFVIQHVQGKSYYQTPKFSDYRTVVNEIHRASIVTRGISNPFSRVHFVLDNRLRVMPFSSGKRQRFFQSVLDNRLRDIYFSGKRKQFIWPSIPCVIKTLSYFNTVLVVLDVGDYLPLVY